MVQRQELGSKIATQACVIKEEVLGPLVWKLQINLHLCSLIRNFAGIYIKVKGYERENHRC